jgi:NADH:ubiquinone oxidoreductase subunit 5 (subunit L)/multisubunit Na+/H+ antiporter MnhA subunit
MTRMATGMTIMGMTMRMTIMGAMRTITPHAHDAHGHDDHHAHDHGHESDGTAGYHPHESPIVMLIPLIMLSIGAIFAASSSRCHSSARVQSPSGTAASHVNEHLAHAMHEIPELAKLMPSIVMLLGLAIAYWAYMLDRSIPGRFVDVRGLYRFLLNKWYFDELYDLIFVKPPSRSAASSGSAATSRRSIVSARTGRRRSCSSPRWRAASSSPVMSIPMRW